MVLDNIINGWVAASRDAADWDDLQNGENISLFPEIKIAFDGYGENDDNTDNLSLESYAVYIHKDAANSGFVFPEHGIGPLTIVHRPSEEVCHFVWHNIDDETYEGDFLMSVGSCDVKPNILKRVVEEISGRHSG
jgi:hypothetical protein